MTLAGVGVLGLLALGGWRRWRQRTSGWQAQGLTGTL